MAGKQPGILPEKYLAQLSASGKLSDVVLISRGGHEFKMHKVILCAHSSYFRSVLENTKNSNGICRRTLDEDPSVLQRMMDYIYKDAYMPPSAASNAFNATKIHVNAYAAGHKFGVYGLKDYATDNFHDAIIKRWDDARQVMPAIVRNVYGRHHNTADIKHALLRICADHRKELESDQAFHGVLAELPEFLKEFWLFMQGSWVPSTSRILNTACFSCKRKIFVVMEDPLSDIYCPKCGKSNYRHGLLFRDVHSKRA